MRDDKRSGFGILTLPGKYKFSGEFENNKFHGKGELIYDSGRHYTGGF